MDNTFLYAEVIALCQCVYEAEIIKLVQQFLSRLVNTGCR